MIQEVVNAVTQADSLAQIVGGQTGAHVATLVSLGLSILLKFAVDLGKKLSSSFDNAPPTVKAFAVVAFGQLVTFVAAKTGIVLQGDLTTLETTLSGLVIAVSSMGVHGLTKTFRTTKTS